MNVAFTGPSSLTRKQELAVVKSLESLPVDEEADIWRSGCAFGVDTIVAHQAILMDIEVELYVPAAPHNEALVKEMDKRGDVTIFYCKPVPHEPYRLRNEWMLDEADKLVAFSKSPTYYRSGEWMTINIARKLEVEHELFVIPKGES